MVGVHQEGNEGRSDEEELLYLQLLTRSVGWGRLRPILNFNKDKGYLENIQEGEMMPPQFNFDTRLIERP